MDKTERFLLQLQAVLDTIPDAVRKLDISCVDGVLAIRDGVDGSIEDMTAFEVLNTLAVRLTEIDKR